MAPANWYYDSDTDDFVCDDCNFSFYHKSQLMRHLTVATTTGTAAVSASI